MENRKQIPVDREILVMDNTGYGTKVTKVEMAKAISQMREDEQVVKLYRDHGHSPAPFAMEEGETVWHDNTLLVVRSFREETDQEFLDRKKSEEQVKHQQEEKEKLDYLRLKAKFEPVPENSLHPLFQQILKPITP